VDPPTPGGWAAVEAALDHAAWYGHPGTALTTLPTPDLPDGDAPQGRVPQRVRWLAGVCLGAVGRYRTAARWLAPGGEPAGSLAASCLASHLRQVGRHAEAEPLDRLALSTATDSEARADALIGLVADAVGRHELAVARERLDAATEGIAVTTDHGQWRVRVRLEWVNAETALLAGEAARAVEIGRTAQRISRTASAYRHTVKSTLVLGVALDAAGRTRAAARVLRSASHGATRLGLIPLLTPIHSVLSGTLQDRAPLQAARERLRADAAQSSREDPAESQSFR
jgi:hypothetical protein